MSISSVIDMLITIKNAYAVRHERVLVPHSSIKFEVAKILKDSGFVGEISRKKKRFKNSAHPYLEIKLKYDNKIPAMNDVKLISKPSRHLYVKIKEVKPVKSGYGISIISTSKGIMTDKDAKKQKLGGEIMAQVW